MIFLELFRNLLHFPTISDLFRLSVDLSYYLTLKYILFLTFQMYLTNKKSFFFAFPYFTLTSKIDLDLLLIRPKNIHQVHVTNKKSFFKLQSDFCGSFELSIDFTYYLTLKYRQFLRFLYVSNFRDLI